MPKLEALKEVYSYMFPEVKTAIFHTVLPSLLEQIAADPNGTRLISQLKTDADLLNLIEDYFREGFLSQFLKTPAEMDAMHIPIIQKYIDFHSSVIDGLDDFHYQYPTAGSEEGIREVLTHLLTKGVEEIYVLRGEYEGYNFVGQTRGYKKGTEDVRIKTIEIDPEATKFTDLKPGWFFISNPSARDGNVIPNELINEIRKAGHNIFYDLAYADSTNSNDKFDLKHESDRFAVVSFSKPYGLFYFRAGFTFGKEEISSLYGNKWFKVAPSLVFADKVMDEIKPWQLFEKYRQMQEEIVGQINKEFDLGMRVSDALLLGHLRREDVSRLNPVQLELIANFRRGDGYRFCLKPYYEKMESQRRF